jgi:very-short-patch-repair endonuclease
MTPRKTKRKPAPDLEGMLLGQIAERGLPAPVRQTNLPRKTARRAFKADFLWPEHRLILEVHGGVFTGGRHVTGAGFERDKVKANLAVLAGYRLLEVTGSHVRDGSAVSWLADALGIEKSEAGFGTPRGKQATSVRSRTAPTPPSAG